MVPFLKSTTEGVRGLTFEKSVQPLDSDFAELTIFEEMEPLGLGEVGNFPDFTNATGLDICKLSNTAFNWHCILDMISTSIYTVVGATLNILILLVLCSGDPGDASRVLFNWKLLNQRVTCIPN